jgi:predicted NBD/HSP70 family sugar kinase
MVHLPKNGNRPSTGNMTLTRQLNRSLILGYIRLAGPTGVTALAQALGLHRTTVYSQVRALVADGLLTLGPTVQSGTGRPKKLVWLNLQSCSVIGAHLDIDNVQAVVSDLQGTILDRRCRPIDRGTGFDTIYTEIVQTVKEAVESARHRGRPPMGIGIAVPGLVEQAGGRIRWTVNLGWHNVDLGPMLQQQFGLPVSMKNGAHASLLGEHYFGAGRGLHDWIYLNAGAEIAGGFILGGQPYFGQNGQAGEIGHTVLEPDGPACSCGNRGCWEALACERALYRYYREAGGGGELTLTNIVNSAAHGDEAADRALDRISRYLALGIVNLLHTFDPDKIVIGGHYATIGDVLLDRIANHLARFNVLTQGDLRSKLALSTLGTDVPVLGAVSTVLYATIDAPRVI